MAPEVIKKKYTEKCDIWSCGVILYVLICGYPPFNAEDLQDLYKKICKGTVDLEEDPWPGIKEVTKDLLLKMLTVDYNVRITA